MPLKLRRGTDAERQTVTPAAGEPIYTTDTKKLYVGDGTTQGGIAVDTTAGGSLALDNLADVSTAGSVDGNVIKYNGASWESVPLTLDNIGDVDTTGAVTGSVIKYNGASWEVGTDDNTVGGGGIALTDLTVVQNAAGTAGLTYNNSTGEFTYTPPDLSDLGGDIPGNLDISGSVFGDDSTLLVDGVRSQIPADVIVGTAGFNLDGSQVTNATITNSTISTTNLDGGTYTNATVDGVLSGTISGTFAGDVTGNITGEIISVNTGLPVTDTTQPTAVFTGDVNGQITHASGTSSFDNINVTDTLTALTVASNSIISDGGLEIDNSSNAGTSLTLNADSGGFTVSSLTDSFSNLSDFPQLSFAGQRGTFGTPLTIQNGDVLGALFFGGHNGTDVSTAAALITYADDTTFNTGFDNKIVIGGAGNIISGNDKVIEYSSSTGTTKIHSVRLASVATGAEPATPEEGTMVFDTTTKKFKGWDGTAWQDFH